MGVVNHFAFGYFGISQLPIAGPGSNVGGAVRDVVNAPVVGVRYWLNERIGIDGGIGFGVVAGSTELINGPNDVNADKPNKWGLGFHAGVPLAFAHATHYVFELVPEANLGFANGGIKGGPGVPDQSLSGFRLDLGARVGAEVHFGFIGVPQLSLQASIGVYFRREAFKWSQGGNSASDGSTFFATSVQADPWAIFADNISALYYF